jgi:hypothetical protein
VRRARSGAWEVAERNPLWTAFVAMAVDDKAEIADGVRSLREFPVDLRTWAVDNSHRKDALPNGTDRFDKPQFDTVFPYDEIRSVWWNGNFYAVKEGGSARPRKGRWHTCSPTGPSVTRGFFCDS